MYITTCIVIIQNITVNKGEAVSKLREFQDRYSLWIRRSIVETRNLEERSAMFRNMFHLLKVSETDYLIYFISSKLVKQVI